MTDLRELIKTWRGPTGAPTHVTGPEWNGYRDARTRCADELERALAAQPARSPSYDALLIIARSVCGALDRAGITDCDDPGEAIDVMREGFQKRIAELESAQPAPDGEVALPRHPFADVFVGAEGWDHAEEAAILAYGDARAAAAVAAVTERWREHGDQALAHVSNALDDLQYSPDQRPVPLLNEAMFHIRAMLAAVPQPDHPVDANKMVTPNHPEPPKSSFSGDGAGHVAVLRELSATLLHRSSCRHDALEWAIRQIAKPEAAEDGAAEDSGRTDRQIVDQTEELAALFMLEIYNRESATGATRYRDCTDPRGKHCWQLACRVQEMLTATDPENSVEEVDDMPELPAGSGSSDYECRAHACRRQIAEMQAEVDRLRAGSGEAVAEVVCCGESPAFPGVFLFDVRRIESARHRLEVLGAGTKLYAGAPPAVSLPNKARRLDAPGVMGMVQAGDWAIPLGHGVVRVCCERYAKGWNDCIDELSGASPPADAEALKVAVIALANEREEGYRNREHGDLVNKRVADKLVALARRLSGGEGL